MKNDKEKIRKIVRETLNEEILIKEYSYIFEGIDVNMLNKTVSFNSTHEKNVNTSVLLNPTYSKIGTIFSSSDFDN